MKSQPRCRRKKYKMAKIPEKLRLDMQDDPYYYKCSRNDLLNDHICQANPLNGQRIEWEHAFQYANNQIQEYWAIIPLCWWAHSGPGMVKEINHWIALNRASDEDLLKYPRAEFISMRERLNRKYKPVDRPVSEDINYEDVIIYD